MTFVVLAVSFCCGCCRSPPPTSPLFQARERSQEALLMPMYRHDDPTVMIKRAPWRQLGWYTFAVGWVDQQLAAHAIDHNGKKMQRDGPMYQITLTDEHCVFRCATRHHGDMYFSVASKKSKNKCSSVIAKYMSDIKFWRRYQSIVLYLALFSTIDVLHCVLILFVFLDPG